MDFYTEDDYFFKKPRIPKSVFKEYSEVDKVYKGLPFIPDEYKPKIKIIGKKYNSFGEEENV